LDRKKERWIGISISVFLSFFLLAMALLIFHGDVVKSSIEQLIELYLLSFGLWQIVYIGPFLLFLWERINIRKGLFFGMLVTALANALLIVYFILDIMINGFSVSF